MLLSLACALSLSAAPVAIQGGSSPAELLDGAQPAGAGDLGGEDLPVPTADDAVGTAVRTDDHTPPPDDAPTTAPRWFDPSASTRPTSTEARATWGAPTAPSRLVDPLHATRPTVDYYDPPQQQHQTQTQQQRARSTRRGSDAAHDLHYDHENGTGWETAPGKRTRDAFGVGVSGRVLPNRTGSRVLGAAMGEDAARLASRLVCFGFDGYKPDDHAREMIAKGCGACIIFDRNIRNPEQVATLCADLKRLASPRPLLVMIDQEGGRVRRFRPPHFADIPAAASIG